MSNINLRRNQKEFVAELPFDDSADVNWCDVPPCDAHEPFMFRLRNDPTKDIVGMTLFGGNLTRPGTATGNDAERDIIILCVFQDGGISSLVLSELKEENSIGFVRMLSEEERVSFHGGGEDHQERRR